MAKYEVSKTEQMNFNQKQFGYQIDRLDELNGKMTKQMVQLEERVSQRVDTKIAQLEERLIQRNDQLEERLIKLMLQFEQRIEHGTAQRMTQIENMIREEVNDKIDRKINRLGDSGESQMRGPHSG